MKSYVAPYPMMEIPDKKYLHGRMRVINWCADGLGYVNQIQAKTGQSLASIVEHSRNRMLHIDCTGVNKVDEHALQPFVNASRKHAVSTIFVHLRDALQEDLLRMLKSDMSTLHTKHGAAVIFGKHSLTAAELNRLNKHATDVEQDCIYGWVHDSFVKHASGRMERLSSTPILSSGAFNAQALMSDPLQFTWICVLLADKLNALMQNTRLDNPRILAASLRASPFAAALSQLLNPRLDIELVDHLGPRQNILEVELSRRDEAHVDYIYVGDFLLLGSELKLARNYAKHLRSRVRYALCIGHLLRLEEYGNAKLGALVHLPTCRRDAKFRVL